MNRERAGLNGVKGVRTTLPTVLFELRELGWFLLWTAHGLSHVYYQHREIRLLCLSPEWKESPTNGSFLLVCVRGAVVRRSCSPPGLGRQFRFPFAVAERNPASAENNSRKSYTFKLLKTCISVFRLQPIRVLHNTPGFGFAGCEDIFQRVEDPPGPEGLLEVVESLW